MLPGLPVPEEPPDLLAEQLVQPGLLVQPDRPDRLGQLEQPVQLALLELCPQLSSSMRILFLHNLAHPAKI